MGIQIDHNIKCLSNENDAMKKLATQVQRALFLSPIIN